MSKKTAPRRTKAKTKTKALTREVSGRMLRAAVTQVFMAEVGEYATPAAEAQRAELEMAAQLAREGPVNGETFRFMRGALGVQAKALGGLLGVAAETVSRWETGARDVDRATWLVLGGLVLERVGRPAELQARMERIASA